MFKLIISFIFIAILSLFPSSFVLATVAPIQLTPLDGATVTTTRLDWQAPTYQLYTTSPYRIQVDDDPLFTTIDKDTYTTNTFYTPVLTFGTWYWKLKAKDLSGIWSDWSTIWSFTYSDTLPTPTPTETPIPTPTNTPSPTPTVTPTPTPTEIPSPTPTETPYPTITVSLTPTISPKPHFICHLISKPIKFKLFNFYFPSVSCSLQ